MERELEKFKKEIEENVEESKKLINRMMSSQPNSKLSYFKIQMGIKLKHVIQKRFIISSHLEQVMALYDIAKTKTLMVETPAEKSM
jgi:hypothetical protein